MKVIDETGVVFSDQEEVAVPARHFTEGPQDGQMTERATDLSWAGLSPEALLKPLHIEQMSELAGTVVHRVEHLEAPRGALGQEAWQARATV